MQRCAFTPYEGKKPYIFVSYAHKDSDRVFPVLEELDRRGYQIWYDDGIAPGSEWPENIAQHLDACSLTLAFVSPASIASANCRREITFALSKKKPFLGIVLEKTEMSLGMELQLSAQQCIMKYTYESEAAFYDKVCSCPDLKPCLGAPKTAVTSASDPQAAASVVASRASAKPLDKKLAGMIAGAAAAVVAAVALIVVLVNSDNNAEGSLPGTSASTSVTQGTVNSTPPADKTDAPELLYSNEQITADTVSYICKHTQLKRLGFQNCIFDKDAFAGTVLPAALEIVSIEDCTGIEDLTVLGELDGLKELYLVNASVSDDMLPSFSGKALAVADISGNPGFSDLSKFSQAENMEQFIFSNTAVASVEVLADMKKLSHIDGSGTAVEDLTPLTELTEIKNLYFANCGIETIGASFKCLHLSRVDMSGNKLEELTAFENCVALTWADFSYNNLSFAAILSKNARTLEYLSLSGNTNLYSSDVSFVANCAKLKELYLDGVALFDLDFLGELHLTRLSANRCRLSDISGLEHLEDIESLSLSYNSISDISVLAGLRKSVVLDLSFNSALQDVSALNSGIHYKYLNLSCGYLDPASLPELSGDILVTIAAAGMLEDSFVSGGFASYAVLLCPLDQVVAYENKFGQDAVRFVDNDTQYIELVQENGIDHRYLLDEQ